MPRRGAIAKREVLPDPVYRSKVLTKLVNQIMLDGKKSLAENKVEIIKRKGKNSELVCREGFMDRVKEILGENRGKGQ